MQNSKVQRGADFEVQQQSLKQSQLEQIWHMQRVCRVKSSKVQEQKWNITPPFSLYPNLTSAANNEHEQKQIYVFQLYFIALIPKQPQFVIIFLESTTFPTT